MRKVLVLVAAVLSVAAIGVTHPFKGQKASSPKVEVATPVQEGVLNDRQREHSKLYKDYKGMGRLRDLIQQQKYPSDGVTITLLPGTPELAIGGRNADPQIFLNSLVAGADAIVVGTVTDKISQLTENGAFIFTDYQLTLEEVLKGADSAGLGLNPQSSIVVTRPGGKILLDGRVVTARDRSFKSLETEGRYLLFLKLIPTTGAYRAVNEQASFEISNNKLVLLTEAPDTQKIDKDAGSFISDVRVAVAAPGRRDGHE